MKVLHVAETIKGGIASFLDELVPLQLEAFGADQVHLVIPDAHAAELRAVPRHCISTFAHGPSRIGNVLAMMRVCTPMVWRQVPQVLHAHSSFAGAAVRLLHGWPRRQHRLVYTPHAWSFCRDNGPLGRFASISAERILAPLCSAIHCVSNHEAQAALQVGLPPDKLQVVLNGIADIPAAPIPSEISASWPPDIIRVLFVGRFDRQKGIDRVAAIMKKLGGRAHAVVVGSPVSSDQAMPDFGDNATLVGWKSRTAVAAYLASADLLLIPSRWEGLCVVGIEALRARRAIFATDVGGMSDLVLDGHNGRLVPDSCAEELATLIGGVDRAALIEMGTRARARFEASFVAPAMAAGLDTIYSGVR